MLCFTNGAAVVVHLALASYFGAFSAYLVQVSARRPATYFQCVLLVLSNVPTANGSLMLVPCKSS